ncbi:hypothetical protein L7F22_059222 [Adiantum nelumboides]|nr:hypothetical protein [Adiantum nelumboides]
MPSRLTNLVASCLGSVQQRITDVGDTEDSLLSYEDIGHHAYGRFSMAIVQANQLLEDQGQVETGPFGTFIGIYDGHNGPDVSRYINQHLFTHLSNNKEDKKGKKPKPMAALVQDMVGDEPSLDASELFRAWDKVRDQTVLIVFDPGAKANFISSELALTLGIRREEMGCTAEAGFASEKGGMSVEVLQMAFSATEQGVESLVAEAWPTAPQIATVGSCCLVGVINEGTVYIANAGDSRAVLGSIFRATGEITPVQLTTEHNAAVEAVRQELRALHPDDSRIVMQKHGVWRVKGIIQVSRAIGDVYLKKQEFNREPICAQFRLSEPLLRPVLTAEPDLFVHKLQPQDRFLIFGSDGLWEHLSNEDAVGLVSRHPQRGIARRLIRVALEEAAKKREMRYSDLKRIQRGIRRHFHDDITVIVVFLDHEMMSHSRRNSHSKRNGAGGLMRVDSHSSVQDRSGTPRVFRSY